MYVCMYVCIIGIPGDAMFYCYCYPLMATARDLDTAAGGEEDVKGGGKESEGVTNVSGNPANHKKIIAMSVAQMERVEAILAQVCRALLPCIWVSFDTYKRILAMSVAQMERVEALLAQDCQCQC